jgi:hypothetical protein
MLLLGMLLLNSDIYALIGDKRPLLCILERTEDEWEPRIGARAYSPFSEMDVTEANV